LLTPTMATSTFCDKLITLSAALASVSLLIFINNLDKTKKVQFPYQDITASGVDNLCNSTIYDERRMAALAETASKFEEVLEGMDPLQRVVHRMTYRHEAVQASLSLGIILAIVTISVFVTKMWKDTEHHSLTYKQTVKFPSNDDPRSRIKFRDIWRSRGKNVINAYRNSKRRRNHDRDAGECQDQLDSKTAVISLPTSDNGSSGDECDEMTLDPATGVWSTGIGKSANQRLVNREPPGTSSGLGSFRRWRLKRKSKAAAAVNVEKPTLMMRYTGEGAVSLINGNSSDEIDKTL